jgi:L-alanine-DL-glutamate epimerase-like enolase superfamily enzyme
MTHIHDITAFPLAYPEPNDAGHTRYLTLVRVRAADGTTGWGEAITMWPEASHAVAALLEGGLGSLLIGRDPRDVAGAWQLLRKHTWWYGGGGIATFAISALDMALWDLKGKLLNLPVYELLGGKLHDQLRVCISTHPNLESIDAMAADFAAHVAQGVTAVKFGFGKRGAARLGYEPERDIAFVRAVREAVGPHVDVIVDLGQNVRWELPQAIRMIRAFEAFNIRWIEDPLHTDDWAGYTTLRSAIATPICTGEELWTVEQYRRLIAADFADIIIVDAGRAEGISGYWRVQELAAAQRKAINAHTWSSALVLAASVHLSAAAANSLLIELKALPNPMQHELTSTPLVAAGGRLEVPNRPGLGVAIDEAAVARYVDSR